jgi:hypothetical protein
MKDVAAARIPFIQQNCWRKVKMHAVCIVHGDAPALALSAIMVARTRFTAHCFEHEIKDLGRRQITSTKQLNDDVNIEALLPELRSDRRSNRHRALLVEQADQPPKRAALSFKVLFDGCLPLHHQSVLTWRQLDLDGRGREQALTNHGERAKISVDWLVHLVGLRTVSDAVCWDAIT